MSEHTLPANSKPRSFNRAVWALLPLVLLAAVIALFLAGGAGLPTQAGLPPREELTVQRVALPTSNEVIVEVINSGPDPVTIAQVLVDDAYWYFSILEERNWPDWPPPTIKIPYPWVQGEAHTIMLVTSTGTLFQAAIPVAVNTPTIDLRAFLSFALIGIYIGIIPVGLGLMWQPFMRGLRRRTMDAILAMTLGLLVFLLIDTASEGLEKAAAVPGSLQGLILFGASALLAYLLIQVVSSRRGAKVSETAGRFNARGCWRLALGCTIWPKVWW